MPRNTAVAWIAAMCCLCVVAHAGIPSRPGVDAPELAAAGSAAVGFRTLTLVQPAQPDLLAADLASGSIPNADRRLDVDIWYPAVAGQAATPVTYSGQLNAEPPRPDVAFTVPGMAVRDAQALANSAPLLIVSHGYANVTAGYSWLGENLASKGYVVAAISHRDAAYTDPRGLPNALLRRPLDIAFVASELQRSLGEEKLVDPVRTALLGYSMGGYGVLTAAGAALDANSAAVKLTLGAMAPYVSDGPARGEMLAPKLRAVIALAPGGGGDLAAWGEDGLRGITVPLLLIAGDHDPTVDYARGARAFFDQATATERWLLTFHGAGHAIGMGPAPEQMRSRLWDLDWFEDPVWRKDRVLAINLHFITAFLDRYLKGDETRAAYLDVPVSESSKGEWPVPPATWDALSPGTGDITVWKGFQRRHAEGLQLLHRAAGS